MSKWNKKPTQEELDAMMDEFDRKIEADRDAKTDR